MTPVTTPLMTFALYRGAFAFGPGEDHFGDDHRLVASHPVLLPRYDVLVFTDSKGSMISGMSSHSWVEMLLGDLARRGMSWLYVARPKNLTIFFTLMNFLERNALSFRYLLTNVGFVDFTPKKEEFMLDILVQAPSEGLKSQLSYRALSDYRLSSGEISPLFSFDYGMIAPVIAALLERSFEYSLLCGTMEMSPAVPVRRQRPAEFFTQLRETNRLLFDVAQLSHAIHFVQPLKFPARAFETEVSIDAVHFTPYGHAKMYELLRPYVESYFVPEA